jgi:hypothetical protein
VAAVFAHVLSVCNWVAEATCLQCTEGLLPGIAGAVGQWGVWQALSGTCADPYCIMEKGSLGGQQWLQQPPSVVAAASTEEHPQLLLLQDHGPLPIATAEHIHTVFASDTAC